MKFLCSAEDTRREIKRLIRKCERLRWAVAWASTGFDLFELLKKHEDKIAQLIVGIHFYQTHPDFIDTFLDHKNCRFVMRPDGVFHPKLYLFEHGNGGWDCVVGSYNFTRGAFSLNAETAVLFGDRDDGADAACAKIKSAFQKFSARRFRSKLSKSDLNEYRRRWKREKQYHQRVQRESRTVFCAPSAACDIIVSLLYRRGGRATFLKPNSDHDRFRHEFADVLALTTTERSEKILRGGEPDNKSKLDYTIHRGAQAAKKTRRKGMPNLLRSDLPKGIYVLTDAGKEYGRRLQEENKAKTRHAR